MNRRMELSHRIRAARLFQCILCCLKHEIQLHSATRLFFLDQDDLLAATHAPMERMTKEELEGRVITIGNRLRSHCGLFEVHYDSKDFRTPNRHFYG